MELHSAVDPNNYDASNDNNHYYDNHNDHYHDNDNYHDNYHDNYDDHNDNDDHHYNRNYSDDNHYKHYASSVLYSTVEELQTDFVLSRVQIEGLLTSNPLTMIPSINWTETQDLGEWYMFRG